MNSDLTFQILSETHLLYFYGLWQFSVCLFAFLALMAIWWHIGQKQRDFGQVWLALSVLCWCLSGGVEVYYANQYQEAGSTIEELHNQLMVEESNPSGFTDKMTLYREAQTKFLEYKAVKSLQLDGLRSILSLFNSLFILLALPWFRYLPKQVEWIIKSNFWPFLVGLPFLFSLLPTLSKMIFKQNYGFISELDVYFSILTLGFLGIVLWESFAKRRLVILAWLSLLCIIITFIAQVLKLTSSSIDLSLFSAIFKTSLIMLFFALALSWVKELAEHIIPEPESLFLAFTNSNTLGKANYVSLIGIPGVEQTRFSLTPALYDLLLKFARNKINQTDGWLEIKPKNNTNASKAYDINDHNEIRRLLKSILDGIFGEGQWTKVHHEKPLKATLFEMSEKRSRQIRLRIPVKNINIL